MYAYNSNQNASVANSSLKRFSYPDRDVVSIAQRHDPRMVNKRDTSRFSFEQGPHAFPTFSALRLDLKVDEPLINLNLKEMSYQTKELAFEVVEEFFNEIFQIALMNGGEATDYVHLYMGMPGIDFTFTFNPAGENAVTLEQLLGRNGRDSLMQHFLRMIQSSTKAKIDQNTRIRVYLFRPPQGSGRNQMNNNTGKRMCRALRRDDYFKKTRGVRRILISDAYPVCMAAAIIICLAVENNDDKTISRYTRPDRKTSITYLTDAAVKLMLDAQLDYKKPCGLPELNVLSKYVNKNIHVYTVIDGILDLSKVFHSTKLYNRSHIYLLLIDNHYHSVTNIQVLLRNFSNPNRVIYDECQIVFSNITRKNHHQCTFNYTIIQNNISDRPKKNKKYEIEGFKYDYFPNCGKVIDSSKYIKRSKEKVFKDKM